MMVNDNTEILIRADDKLPNNITLKNVLILITWIIKNIYKRQKVLLTTSFRRIISSKRR